jgi:hypothetical protein
MIIKHKHGRLEFLPRQDLPHNSNSSLKVFKFSHAYFFASIGGFLWFLKTKFLQQVLDKNLSPSSRKSLIWGGYPKPIL